MMSDNRFEALVLQLDNYDGPGVYLMGDVPKEEQEAAKGTNAYKRGWNDCIMEHIRPYCDMVARAKEGMSDDKIMLLASGHAFQDTKGLITLNMSDTWAWATGWSVEILEDEIPKVARLFREYGFAGLLYWHSQKEGGMRSEFHDINRRVEFVEHEERILAEFPDSNKRAYHKASYQIGQ